MQMGRGTLRVEESGSRASDKLLTGLATIQAIYRTWDPTLTSVDTPGVTRAVREPQGERVAAFFSGGVDSFYTLLQNEAEITDLVFVHGLDIPLDAHELRQKSADHVQRVARDFGKGVIEIETNIRRLLDEFVPWGVFGHGSALAAIAHQLDRRVKRILIPASYTYAHLFPWGTHPVLDPHWGSEALTFVHDGCEATRVAKVGRIAASGIALDRLRVCYKNPNGAYNCGECEKCVRTMINLQVNGALERCPAFATPLKLKNVRKMDARRESTRAFVSENLQALRTAGGSGELEVALDQVLRRGSGGKLSRFRLGRWGRA